MCVCGGDEKVLAAPPSSLRRARRVAGHKRRHRIDYNVFDCSPHSLYYSKLHIDKTSYSNFAWWILQCPQLQQLQHASRSSAGGSELALTARSTGQEKDCSGRSPCVELQWSGTWALLVFCPLPVRMLCGCCRRAQMSALVSARSRSERCASADTHTLHRQYASVAPIGCAPVSAALAARKRKRSSTSRLDRFSWSAMASGSSSRLDLEEKAAMRISMSSC